MLKSFLALKGLRGLITGGGGGGIAPEPEPDHVVDFVSTGTDYLTQSGTGAVFNSAGSLVASGGWMAGYAYYDGTNWGGVLMGNGNLSAADQYIILARNNFQVRYSATLSTTAMSNPSTAGWYFLTGSWTRGAATTVSRVDFWRNGSTVTAAGAQVVTTPTNLNSWRAGEIPAVTTTSLSLMKQAGLAWGYGSLCQTMHDWVYNGGAMRDISEYDFAGDANLTLEGYWPFAQIGAGTLAGTDAGLADTIGGLDTWTQTGSPVWAALPPPWTSPGIATITAASVPSGATNTLVLTATLPTGKSWQTLTIDTAKIDIWATVGFGPISISGSSSSVASNVATVTLTLNRSLYASEAISYEVLAGWLTDSISNTTAAGTSTAVNSSPTADPANWPGVSLGRIAAHFTTPVAAKFYRAERMGVYVPVGTVIDAFYPAQSTSGGLLVHGAQMNPFRQVQTNAQSYDARSSASYGAGGVLSLPTAALANGDVVVKARSNINRNSENGGTASHPVTLYETLAFYCETSSPTTHQFPPAAILKDTGAGRYAGFTKDISAATYPSYATTGMDAVKPTYAEILFRIGRSNPIMGQIASVEDRRLMTAAFLSYQDGYGQWLLAANEAAALFLMSDAPDSEKRVIDAWMQHRGHQTYGAMLGSSVYGLGADGAQNCGEWAFLCRYLAENGMTADLATLEADIGTNELKQVFLHDATTIGWFTTSHSAANLPAMCKIKTVASAGALTVTTNAWSGSAEQNLWGVGALLKRVSDGATARITAVNQGTYTFTIDAQPTPAFTAADQVYLVAGYTLTAGDASYAVKGCDSAAGPSTTLAYAEESYNAPYRNQYVAGGQSLGLRALGQIHSSHEKVWTYVKRSALTNTPAAGNDFPASFESWDGTKAWAAAMYAAHGAAVDAVSQTVG